MRQLIDQLMQSSVSVDTSILNSAMLVFIIGNLVWLSRKFGDLCRRMTNTEKWQSEAHICPNAKIRKKRGEQ